LAKLLAKELKFALYLTTVTDSCHNVVPHLEQKAPPNLNTVNVLYLIKLIL